MFKGVKEILKGKVARDSFTNLGTRLSILLISVGFIAYISRQLDRTEVGMFALLFIFYGLLGMVGGLGLPASAIRLIPELREKDQLGKVSDIIKITIFSSTLLSLVAVVLGISINKFLARIFLKSEDFANLMNWIVITSFFYSIYNRILLIYQSLRQFGKLAILSIFTVVSQRLLAVIFFAYGYGLKGIFAGFLLGAIMGVFLGALSLKKYLFGRYHGYPLKEHIRFSLPYYGQGVSRFMFSQMDQTLIALLFTPEKLAIYFIAKKIVSGVTLVFEALLEPVIPKLAEIKAKGIAIFKNNMDRVYEIFSFLGLVGVTLVFINGKNFMFWVGGEHFAHHYFLLNILAISIFLYALFSLPNIGIYLLERPKEMFKLFIYVGLANMTGGIVFGLLFGLVGFAWAQSLGFLLGICLIRYRYREKWVRYIWSRDVAHAFLVCSGFIFGYYLNKYFFPVGDNLLKLTRPLILNALFLSAAVLFFLRRRNILIWR